ncbi:MAG: glycine cleavage system protein GcvH [Verrucomicrobiae bacterium]|nr:glycine cleavage system protein GcvH [Verrucomicrobiae bacterium]
MIPENLKYTKSHEWIRLDGDRLATMGITAYAVQQLGDIVFLDLPKVGAKAVAGQTIGVIESVKAAVDLYAPISGEVLEVNTLLAENFEALAKDPYGQGWMAKIRGAEEGVPPDLLSAAEYQKWIAQEAKA